MLAARYSTTPMRIWATWPPRHIRRFYFFAIREHERNRYDLFSCFAKIERQKWLDKTPDELEQTKRPITSDSEFQRMKQRHMAMQQRKEGTA